MGMEVKSTSAITLTFHFISSYLAEIYLTRVHVQRRVPYLNKVFPIHRRSSRRPVHSYKETQRFFWILDEETRQQRRPKEGKEGRWKEGEKEK